MPSPCLATKLWPQAVNAVAIVFSAWFVQWL